MEKRNLPEGAATGGAVGLSALGSAVGLCCIGPWSVALFGVGGSIFLNRLEPFRPFILITALALLVWAFWRVYRPQPAGAQPPCEKRQSSYLKASLWISAGFLLVAFFARDLQMLLLYVFPVGETG